MSASSASVVDQVRPTDGPGDQLPVPDRTAWDRVRGWRPTRRGVGLAALLLVALIVIALTAPTGAGYLDPNAVDPSGSRAVVNVLRGQGVEVVDAQRFDDVLAHAEGATVLVTDTMLPTDESIEQLLAAEPALVVLVESVTGEPVFVRLAAGIELAEPGDDDPIHPGSCQLPAARAAGAATLPGMRYDARAWSGASEACYDEPSRAAVVALAERPRRPEVVLLGSGHPLTNAGLDEEGNAALALNMLGSRDTLVWWRPSATDPALAADAPTPLAELLPPWVIPAALQILVACLLVAWWRGRRLGRLVVEPLPVVVPAGETAAGHARLMHANHTRGEAAAHLRAAARQRLAARLGVAPSASREELVAVTAQRSARPAGDVGALLYGRDPEDDVQLVQLDHDLAALLQEVGGA